MPGMTTTITSKGQVTIPAKLRRMFGIKPKDTIAFRVKDGEIVVSRVDATVESAFGAVRPLRRPENVEQIIREAKEDRAAKRWPRK